MKPDKPSMTARAARSASGTPARSALAVLSGELAAASEAARAAQGLPPGGTGPWPDLRSTLRFRETWERLGAEVQVQQARARAPQNAGPLNPQRLVIETLALMGELSPHYLRRFLAQTETLLWLDEAQGHLKSTANGRKSAGVSSGRPARTRK